MNSGSQTGIKGGWSSYQNVYANPVDKPGPGPGDQPGPPYQSSSAYIDHYRSPPSHNNYFAGATTPSSVAHTVVPPVINQQQTHPNQNGFFTLYNTKSFEQTSYAPAPQLGNTGPTLSPNTLIASTPSG